MTFDSCISEIVADGYDEGIAKRICSFLSTKLESRNQLNRQLTTNDNDRKLRSNGIIELNVGVVEDTKYMITIPSTITTEGVMNGGYKPKSELAKSFWTFDGIPVTFSHPPQSEVTSLQECKGWISDIDFDFATGDVIALVNILKTEETTDTIKQIKDGKLNQVSIGYWSTDIKENGFYNDDKRTKKAYKYDRLETDIVGNHLAIMLKGEKGACSPEMGCGLINKIGDIKIKSEVKIDMGTDMKDVYRTFHENGVPIDDTVEAYVMDENGNLVLKILGPEDIDQKQW